MTIGAALKAVTFSGFIEPKNQVAISDNLVRISIWCALGSGTVALVSFLFSRSIVQEGSWRAFAPHVFQASLASCGTFTAVVAYYVYLFFSVENCKSFNERVLFVATSSAYAGLFAAATTWPFNKPLEDHLYSFLAYGVSGSILSIFLNRQNKQLATMNGKKIDQSQ